MKSGALEENLLFLKYILKISKIMEEDNVIKKCGGVCAKSAAFVKGASNLLRFFYQTNVSKSKLSKIQLKESIPFLFFIFAVFF